MTDPAPNINDPKPDGAAPSPQEITYPQRKLRPTELSTEAWEPDKQTLIQKWTRGWRLVAVLGILVVGYGMWRGKADYQRVKNWRARGLADDALVKAAAGDVPGAQALMSRAAILAPREPNVLRKLAGFCADHKDPMALYALRQLALSGQATLSDWEQLCGLSFSMGHPEMAPLRLLREWAMAPEDQLSVGQLKLSTTWLLGRGMARDAEQRLRAALKRLPDEPALKLALCSTLLTARKPQELASNADEVTELLQKLRTDKSLPVDERAAAIRSFAGSLIQSQDKQLLTSSRLSFLTTAFADLAKEVGMPQGLSYELLSTSLQITADPSGGRALVEATIERGKSLPAEQRTPIARWLVDNRLFEQSLAFCNASPELETNAEWFTAKLDALFALKETDKAVEMLNRPNQPLAAVLQKSFLHRIATSQNGVSSLRPEVEKAAKDAPPKDTFQAGQIAERFGDRDLALKLYGEVENDERVGLSARLGMVRCLDADPARVAELIRALESVLGVWPQLDDARNDLIYLRLLENKATEQDYKIAEEMEKNSPWLLAYRVTAALAKLRQNQPAESMAILEKESLPWQEARKGWQAVRSAVLGANGRTQDAQVIAVRLIGEKLRPGEHELLKKFMEADL